MEFNGLKWQEKGDCVKSDGNWELNCINEYDWLIDWWFYFNSVTYLVQILFSMAKPYIHHLYQWW